MTNIPKKLRKKAKNMTDGELLQATANWNFGAGQSLKGDATADFAERLLDTFDPVIRRNIEADIEGMHEIKNLNRFRRRVILFLAAALLNHSVSGKPVDIIKLAEDANRRALDRLRK